MPARRAALIATFSVATACQPPPPAPEGLQDSLTYLFRSFFAEDKVVGAGLTGFLDWFDAEGDELLGQKADMENVGEFTLGTLSEAEVGILPIEGEVVLEYAPGTVALSELACPWVEVERYLVRSDQDVVFGEFDSYERSFLTSREDFEGAADGQDFAALDEPLAEPYAEPWGSAAEDAALTTSLLYTDNQASSSEVGVTMDFELLLVLRHGLFDVQGEETLAFLILTWMPQRAVSEGGDNSIEQSYSLELDIARPAANTLRLMASWIQVEGTFDHDSDMVKVVGVNKNLDASERLMDICTGEEDLPPE